MENKQKQRPERKRRVSTEKYEEQSIDLSIRKFTADLHDLEANTIIEKINCVLDVAVACIYDVETGSIGDERYPKPLFDENENIFLKAKIKELIQKL